MVSHRIDRRAGGVKPPRANAYKDGRIVDQWLYAIVNV
jgi:hypothetical protein